MFELLLLCPEERVEIFSDALDVLDAALHPAAGASGLPAGLLVPHLSPADGLLSRLSRAGVRTTVRSSVACNELSFSRRPNSHGPQVPTRVALLAQGD